MREILPSVGIDIGTSTTQVIFSKLEIDNTSGSVSYTHLTLPTICSV